MRSGISLDVARASVAAVDRRTLTPQAADWAPLFAWRAGTNWRRAPLNALETYGLFLAIPLGVLLLGCANVVSLELARATDRARELSVRLALGASRAHIVRLLALEGGMFAVLAGIAGWEFAHGLLALAARFAGVPMSLDRGAAVLAFLLVLAVAGVSGLAPAWLAARGVVATGLREVRDEGPRYRRFRAGLVVTQIASSVALLYLSGLGLRAIWQTRPALPPDAAHVLVAGFSLADSGYSPERVSRFLADTLDRLPASPDVQRAAFADSVTLSGFVRWAPNPDVHVHAAAGGLVTPGWFDVVGARTLAGRTFAPRDTTDVVVNAALARVLARDGAPVIGRSLWTGYGRRPISAVHVVGVVDDRLGDPPDAATPRIYLPMPNDPPTSLVLVARVSNLIDGAAQLRAAVAGADPTVPWLRLDTLNVRLRAPFVALMNTADAGVIVGLIALTLSATGLFAALSYLVRRRTREIGVRVAIGATPRDILSNVLGQALQLTSGGVILGLAVGVPIAFVMRSAIVGVSPVDAAALVELIALLTTVTLAAAALPAYRAARVDPLVALRHD